MNPEFQRSREQSPSHKPSVFSFICPEDRIEEARTLLGQMKGVSLSSEPGEHIVRFFLDPDTGQPTTIEGAEMSGITQASSQRKLVRELAEARIAGYSRPTQVLFAEFDPEALPTTSTPLYKPKIEFDEESLMVGFDHDLSTPAEELDLTNGPVTWFSVHLDREPYIGLQFIPRHILKVVAEGLKTYETDEQLTPEQQKLVTLGLNQLENLIRENN